MRAKYFLFLFSIIASLYLAEGIVNFFLKSSIILYYLPPNSQQRHVTMDFDVLYNYNNYSLRGKNIDFNTEFDVIVLGDSFPFGIGVPEEETICGYLERKGIRVVSLSEPATNPIQYYQKFIVTKKLGLYSKNLILFIFIGNDFQNITDKKNISESLTIAEDYLDYNYNIKNALTLDKLSYLMYAVIQKIFFKDEFLIHKYELIRTFKYDWFEWFTGKKYNFLKEKYTSIDEEKYLTNAQINEKSIIDVSIIINHLNSQLNYGTNLSVVLIPDWHFVRQELDLKYQYFLDKFKSLLNDNIKIVDLHDKCQDDIFFPNDGHWNTKGHKLVADVLIKEVILPK